MRFSFIIVILAVFVCNIAVGAQDKTENYVAGEILVKIEPGSADRSSEKIAERGGRVVEYFPAVGWQRVIVPKGVSVTEAVEQFKKVDGVIAAQPNFYYHLLATPNDPDFTHAGMYGLTKINAPAAWDLNTGSPNVVVANIDTGANYNHPDLAANMWTNPGEINNNMIDDDNNGFVDDYYGWDFRFNDSDPIDQHGHGTHTSGTIGAVGNNGVGVVGVNWTVRLMTIKIYSLAATDTTSAMLIAAYQYVLMMKNRGVNIRATNNSYGGCPETCGYDQATKDAIDALGNANILNVFAAGNSSTNNDVTPFYPASYTSPSILAVGGSNSTDLRAFNYGLVSVDLAAPAIAIRSTLINGSYGGMNGTSMATPHVSGAAALLSAHNPSLSAQSLKATLMNTVDVLPAFVGFNRTGGRLNVGNALPNQTVCSYNLSTTSITAITKGGYYSVNMTAPANCDFSIKSNVNWIKVSGSDVGSGTQSVTFRVGYNTAITRIGTLTIGGQTVTVTQSRS